jgi:hypothetical protein
MNFKKVIAIFLLFPFLAFADEKVSLPLPASGNVTLPLDEYNRLLELASKPARKTDAPPLPYTIKRADLKLRVNEDSARATIQLQGEVFNRNETKVALATGLTILDARQEGRPLPLEQENNTHTAILSGASDFNVTLEAGMQLNIEAGRASFTIPTPSAGSVRLSLVVPGDHTNVKLSPGIITNRTSENGVTTIEATLVPGTQANVWWTTREVVAPIVPKEVRFLSDVKTLVSVSEADVRIAALADISIVQGQPTDFEIEVPAGYELTGVTGAYLETSELKSGILELKLGEGGPQKSYEFLITMEKNISGTSEDAPFLSFKQTQRETGEVLIEGSGTIELTAKEGGGLKRMDFKEMNPYLRSLAHFPAQAGFRYHRQPSETPTLALEWTRFQDSSVLAAIAERATITTLVTSEGKSLTEVKLLVRNQAQPYVKIALPTGASILSAEVAGEKVKPVEGPDGNRVPLLRAGFRPTGSYTVTFVFLHSGSPFAKKGGSELSLPKMDIPIDLLQWEVFLPERYQVKDFGGDAISASLLPANMQLSTDIEEIGEGVPPGAGGGTAAGIFRSNVNIESLLPGQLAGYVTDPSGAVVANAGVTVSNPEFSYSQTTRTDSAGRWVVSGLRTGTARISVNSPGFKTSVYNVGYDSNRPTRYSMALQIAAATETVEVQASTSMVVSSRDTDRFDRESKKQAAQQKKDEAQQQLAASANVYNLQRKVSGVLPVRVDVPRAGNSYRFIRPLVLDEETKVTFTYKTK